MFIDHYDQVLFVEPVQGIEKGVREFSWSRRPSGARYCEHSKATATVLGKSG